MSTRQLDRKSYTPLYIQIKEAIQEKIENGNLKPGEKIPSESDLQNEFDVSRTTVRLALKELIFEGKLETRQGKGTYVAKPKMEHPLPNLTSFSEDIANKGYKAGAKLISLSQDKVSPKIQEKLGLSKNEEVIILERIRTVDDENVGIQVAYINPKLIDFNKFKQHDFEQESLYNVLEKDFGIQIGEAEETIEAIPADESESKALNLPTGYPVLLLKRLTFITDKTPLEYVIIKYRADRYKYSVSLKR